MISMKVTSPIVLVVALSLPFALTPRSASASCGSAFCPVNTQWAVQGGWDRPGLRMDVRYEFMNQDQPRHGSDRIGVGEIPGHHDEVGTLNRNTLLSLDYGFDRHWGMSLTLPYVTRDHEHLHHHHGELLTERWNLSGLGDARVLGRYRLQKHPVSLLFGLKLPTGDTKRRNAAGDFAERSLQPGTGTTDLVLGVSYDHAKPASAWSWFTQLKGQRALDSDQGFRPGQRLSWDLGVRYLASPRLSLMLQANLLSVGRDHGENAETNLSGGEYVFLSPGISYAVGDRAQLYLFVQQPLYQHVNGVQLTADHGYTFGISARF